MAKATTFFRSKKRANRRVRRAAMRKQRVPRTMALQSQSASIVETVQFTDIDPSVTYNFQFHLYQFQRASRLAPLFKFYKAAKVEWELTPLYNTFQDGTTGGEVSVPYMYQLMNRTGDLVGQNLADIQATGARPFKLVATSIKSYKPNWLLAGLSMFQNGPSGSLVTPSTQGMKPSYDWLPCPNQNVVNAQLQIGQSPDIAATYTVNSTVAANNTPYFGHTLRVDQAVTTGVLQAVARLTCRVHWVFKQPHATFYESPSPNVAVVPLPKSDPIPSPSEAT